jgi:hypothetical protein
LLPPVLALRHSRIESKRPTAVFPSQRLVVGGRAPRAKQCPIP